MFEGFPDRVQKQLVEIGPQNSRIKVIANVTTSVMERRFSPWIGGSILSSLGSF